MNVCKKNTKIQKFSFRFEKNVLVIFSFLSDILTQTKMIIFPPPPSSNTLNSNNTLRAYLQIFFIVCLLSLLLFILNVFRFSISYATFDRVWRSELNRNQYI
jgi:hypothetical protein